MNQFTKDSIKAAVQHIAQVRNNYFKEVGCILLSIMTSYEIEAKEKYDVMLGDEVLYENEYWFITRLGISAYKRDAEGSEKVEGPHCDVQNGYMYARLNKINGKNKRAIWVKNGAKLVLVQAIKDNGHNEEVRSAVLWDIQKSGHGFERKVSDCGVSLLYSGLDLS